MLLFKGSLITASNIDRTSKIGRNVRVNKCTIGRYTYIANNSIVSNATIGSFCSISLGVKIGLGFHPLDYPSTSPVFYSKNNPLNICFVENSAVKERQATVIGNDVLISANVFILDGVKIGDGAVIAAGAVVINDVLPYEIVGGIPAKRLKMRFSENTIEELKNIKFWDWDMMTIKKSSKFFKTKLL